ncbi:methyltransferase type 11, putative [hydrothermal vent metagenome]|uniref:Methyltransferase type 11, putative n=1 Tax=hydrothermal vent metagenome TaxID=652676 RepID=A0A3B1BMI7_9ZZZZ
MRRPDESEILKYLHCPYCKGVVEKQESELACSICNRSFHSFHDGFVMLREENELFPASAYIENAPNNKKRLRKPRIFAKVKSLVPSRSVNLARKRMFARLAIDHGEQNRTILVVGCGNQAEQLNKYFPGSSTTFIFCDIDKRADAKIFCDAHELSFKDGIFDGVISTAVLEHVLYPDHVIAEINRVIKPGGFIYSEIPFLQSVHEGAYDFTRFTMSGHRRLCEKFDEIEAGMIAGPGTALVWSITDFSRALFSNARFSSFAALLSRTLFFWLKYFDYLCKDNPIALDAASCTYFYGKKAVKRTSGKEIIEQYKGNVFRHA